jgi:outer membrane protein
MKNLSLILNGILAVAVIVLFILVLGIKKQLAPSAESSLSTTLPLEGQHIVYIDIDSIMSQYNMSKDITTELQGKLQVSENQLASKEKSLRKEAEDFQYKIDRGLMTRTEAEQVQQGLAMKEQEFYQLQNKLQMQFAEEQQVAQRKVLNAIMDYLKTFEASSEHPYQFVLGNSFGGSILYANQGLNITQQVIEGINKEYEKTKKDQE